MATMVEMREHETRQKLLLDELNHRVKNTLASVQSIAAQTLTHAEGIADFRQTFEDRLMALSATHNLLVERAWESASLRDLVSATLGHYGRPFVYLGLDLHLGANYAVTLGLAMHELATNALKHGAWSGTGRVEVEVAVENGEVVIVWREIGGPPVSPPKRKGFGSRLLQSGVASELGGKVEIDYRRGGLVCTIVAPVSRQMSPAMDLAQSEGAV
jgi:two-component sensor histidine kinase